MSDQQNKGNWQQHPIIVASRVQFVNAASWMQTMPWHEVVRSRFVGHAQRKRLAIFKRLYTAISRTSGHPLGVSIQVVLFKGGPLPKDQCWVVLGSNMGPALQQATQLPSITSPLPFCCSLSLSIPSFFGSISHVVEI